MSKKVKLEEKIDFYGYNINIYAKPAMYEGSKPIYAATITTLAGYIKKIFPWHYGYTMVKETAKDYVIYNL